MGMSQPRKPKGTSEGGQFAQAQRAEAGTTLVESPTCTVYRDGSEVWLDSDGEYHRDDGPAVTDWEEGESWYQHGVLHCDDGPARIYPNGDEEWYQHGVLHREDGPAIVEGGHEEWYLNGERRSPDDPSTPFWSKDAERRRFVLLQNRKQRLADLHSRLYPNTVKERSIPKWQLREPRMRIGRGGTEEWLDAEGRLHREGAPAVSLKGFHESWYRHGTLHRVGGPAIKTDRSTEWIQNGEHHRTDGPAIIRPDGYEAWYQYDELHRDDGPAITYPNGAKAWFQHDKLHRDDGPAIIFADGSEEWWHHGEALSDPGWDPDHRRT